VVASVRIFMAVPLTVGTTLTDLGQSSLANRLADEEARRREYEFENLSAAQEAGFGLEANRLAQAGAIARLPYERAPQADILRNRLLESELAERKRQYDTLSAADLLGAREREYRFGNLSAAQQAELQNADIDRLTKERLELMRQSLLGRGIELEHERELGRNRLLREQLYLPYVSPTAAESQKNQLLQEANRLAELQMFLPLVAAPEADRLRNEIARDTLELQRNLGILDFYQNMQTAGAYTPAQQLDIDTLNTENQKRADAANAALQQSLEALKIPRKRTQRIRAREYALPFIYPPTGGPYAPRPPNEKITVERERTRIGAPYGDTIQWDEATEQFLPTRRPTSRQVPGGTQMNNLLRGLFPNFRGFDFGGPSAGSYVPGVGFVPSGMAPGAGFAPRWYGPGIGYGPATTQPITPAQTPPPPVGKARGVIPETLDVLRGIPSIIGRGLGQEAREVVRPFYEPGTNTVLPDYLEWLRPPPE
jgi:hypothetical protein